MATTQKTSQVVLDVPGIHCDGCIRTIRKTVSRIEGADVVAGDATARTVTVEYDPRLVSLVDLHRALSDHGFPVRVPAREPGETTATRGTRPLGWVLFAIGLAAVLAAVGYFAGFQAFIYGVAMPNAFDRLGVLTVGMIAGVAAFSLRASSHCCRPMPPTT